MKPVKGIGREKRSGSGVGKKRDSRGNVKNEANSASKTTNDVKDKHNESQTDKREILLKEILALGGAEEDLDLVIGELSDSDDLVQESLPKAMDPKFVKELSKFVAGLGIKEHNNDETDASKRDGEEKEANASIRRPAVLQSSGRLEESARDHRYLILEARPDWHAATLPDLPQPDLSDDSIPREMVSELKKHASALLEEESNLYASKNLSSTSSHRFLSTIMSSGTLSDKVSALTLVVQESPVHTVKSFESLLALAKKRSRGQAVTALGAIKDLLGVGAVLPSDRRLRFFEDQPGLWGTLQADSVASWRAGNALPGKIATMHMISWAYEDWLKNTYFEVLKVLEVWCNDEIEFARGRAVTYVYELLREKPEQESNLLRLLVNKLGDPEKKIASRTSHLILQLQITHPLMKPTIIGAIESELLLRSNQGSHAKYYAVNTLNQTILSAKEEDVAQKLLNIYFDMFVNLLKKPEPLKPAPGPAINRKGQVQGGGGTKGKKAMEKAKEELSKQASEETTEKMISAVLTGLNRAFPFANSDNSTLEKHMEMLFKITHSSNFNTSIQALMLIQQLVASKHLREERFYRTLYESLLDPRLITSSKHAMYLNLLFRALKSDLNVKRVKAFAKRLLQVVTLHQPSFICGVLYLLRELEVIFPSLKSLLNNPEVWEELDEEVFQDVPEDANGAVPAVDSQKMDHTHPDQAIDEAEKEPGRYDGRKRDPEHSKADKSCLWELLPYLTHFHPSVSMFATHLLHGSEMPTKPDLASHTLIHFLDRFVYRNAKASVRGLRGSSIMQPLAGGEGQAIFVSSRLLPHHNEPLNSDAFWRKRIEDIAVDEVFFHKYFNQIGKGKQSNGKKVKSVKGTQENDVGNSDDENEDEIWQALVESRPEFEGHSEDDSDLEMLDLDDSEDNSATGADIEGFSGGSDAEDGGSLREDVILPLDEESAFTDVDELFTREMEIGNRLEIATEEKESTKNKRRKMKNLPTFASTEEYADMLADDDDEDF